MMEAQPIKLIHGPYGPRAAPTTVTATLQPLLRWPHPSVSHAGYLLRLALFQASLSGTGGVPRTRLHAPLPAKRASPSFSARCHWIFVERRSTRTLLLLP
ncbi:hypothetical protein ACP70R_019933 [Stipagrostis hirtigluma subsp. patula]